LLAAVFDRQGRDDRCFRKRPRPQLERGMANLRLTG